MLQLAHVVQASGEGQHRVEVLHLEDATVLLVADGASGMSGGAQAAERALQKLSEEARQSKLNERGPVASDAPESRQRPISWSWTARDRGGGGFAHPVCIA